MSSNASTYSNPFAVDPAEIRDINVHARVPLVLDASNSTYFAWKTYFTLLFRENNLVDHVDGTVDSRAMVDDAEWTTIDATIIRWFFTTISKDLFHTVVSAGDDARALWVKLNGLFTDNKLQRRVFLQQEFFDCHQVEQSIDDYCRRLKTLADELRDIGAKVDDDLLLSTLTDGLNEDFGNTASNLTLMPEPSFPKYVAYLRLEERQMKGVKKRVQHHALAAGTSRGAPPPAASPAPRQQPPPPAPPGYFPLPPAPPAPPAAPQQPGGGRRGGGRKQQQAPGGGGLINNISRSTPWTYGTNPWTGVVHAYLMPVPRAPASGILGPRPASHQALFAAQNAAPYSGYGAAPQPAPAYGATPAYGAAAAPAYGAPPAPAYGGFYPPQVPPPWHPALLAALRSAPSPSSYGGGGDWYMDSGATAHMTAHPGNLTSATPVHTPTRITVVTNLLSVRRLARENPITVEFDDIGFSVKDAYTWMVLHRCDSPDELYPVHPSGAATTCRPAAFAAIRRPILALQTDNGKEFDNVAVRNLLASHGTIFRLTCPYTSQQNGRAERVIRTLNDCVRTLLFHSYVPPRFWPDALATASLLINIRPCRSRWNYTPHQLLFGAVPSPSASPAARFAPASSSGEPTSRALGSALPALPAPAAPTAAPLAGPVAAASSAAPVAAAPSAAPAAAPSAAPAAAHLAAPVVAATPLTGVVTRARTGTPRPSTRYTSDEYASAASTSAPSPLPTSARAALRDPNWLAAMREEFDALQCNRT
ncbi:uncharacterized protein [Aegilops tauschii subsp. strangulata]|uniref:uncharacterized protein n=1 Tax=Aegilops tauschii subsp. strangulata TaxID=200361 RepID=UPI003CC89794